MDRIRNLKVVVSLQDSLLLTIVSLGIPSTHLIDLA